MIIKSIIDDYAVMTRYRLRYSRMYPIDNGIALLETDNLFVTLMNIKFKKTPSHVLGPHHRLLHHIITLASSQFNNHSLNLFKTSHVSQL